MKVREVPVTPPHKAADFAAVAVRQKNGVLARLSFEFDQIYGLYAARPYDQGWGKSEGSLTRWSTTACSPHHKDSEISSPRKGGLFLDFFMKWMLLLVLVVIGVGTLMGTTAPPVL